jgi:hypothetical protein
LAIFGRQWKPALPLMASRSRVDQRALRAALPVDHRKSAFDDWGRIFPDQAMTLAAIDRLVHHSTIFETNVDSCRRKAAPRRTSAFSRDDQKRVLIDAPHPHGVCAPQ